jgi:UDP-glucose 4-epimerase
MNTVSNVTNTKVDFRVFPYREGDPVSIRADIEKASFDLNWKHDKPLAEILSEGWDSWKSFRNLWV